MTIKEKIAECFIIPVVVIDDAGRAENTAQALLAGGVKIMEVTLRTEAGLKVIENVAKSCPDLLIGAGTVLSLAQCKEAISRGASFIVSPGYDEEIVEHCLKNNMPVFPGCVTPTEITVAVKAGLDVVKFFPANVYGGLAGIKALSAPFPKIKFIPTGGVDGKNLADFILPQVLAVGGSWVCDRKAISEGKYEAITAACKDAMKIVSEARAK